MNIKVKLPLASIVAAVMGLWASVGVSQETSGSLDAHVHGVSELMIAIEGKEIEIQFESPAMNILGFEHQANSKEDKATVNAAVASLKKHDAIFSFSGSSCKLVDSSVDVSGVLKSDHDHHDHEHKHDHDEGNHSEIIANYHYRCDNLDKLSAIEVEMFKSFPGIHKINVMWLSESKQGAVTLSSKNNKVGIQ